MKSQKPTLWHSATSNNGDSTCRAKHKCSPKLARQDKGCAAPAGKICSERCMEAFWRSKPAVLCFSLATKNSSGSITPFFIPRAVGLVTNHVYTQSSLHPCGAEELRDGENLSWPEPADSSATHACLFRREFIFVCMHVTWPGRDMAIFNFRPF